MGVKTKVLYVSQKLKPYLAEDFESNLCRILPQTMQENGMEIRTFMPRFGSINERRNQLHEVIRLSGKNIVINDSDHQLIIKVASITASRMQVYFIDNDDYFHRKIELKDAAGEDCPDNDERMMFYGRGVLETISKLQWSPDIIHCNSWFSALVPAFVKAIYNDNPIYANSKVVLSLYDDGFNKELPANFIDKMVEQGFSKEDLELFSNFTYENLMHFALDYCDGLIIMQSDSNIELVKYANEKGKEVFIADNENIATAYKEIYERILNK